MPKKVEGITVKEFLYRATRIPLGKKLYDAVGIKDKERGIKTVKAIMGEEGVTPSLVTTDEARKIYESGKKFVNGAPIPDPGDGVKY